MYILVLNQLVTMTLITLGGFVFAKAFKIGDAEQKFLSKVLLYFINPCLVVSSFDLDFDLQKLKQLFFVIFISFLIHGVMILISMFLQRARNEEDKSYCQIDRLALVFTNCGFIGIPLIRGVFGDEGVFYLMGYLVVFNILVWTFGYYQLSGSISLKKVLTNPNIIAVALGLVIFCFPFRIPQLIAKPVKMIGDINTATSMILIGILFANFKLTSRSFIWRLAKVTVNRLIICSIFNMAVLFCIYKLFPDVQDVRTMLFVVLICSMCPAGSSVPSLSCVFDKDSTYASVLVSITTLFCIVTLPTLVAVGEMIIK